MRGLDPRIHPSSEDSCEGDGLPGQARQRRLKELPSPDAVQRVALAERCAAEPGSRLLATRRNRGPGSAKRRFAKCYAPHRARDTDYLYLRSIALISSRIFWVSCLKRCM